MNVTATNAPAMNVTATNAPDMNALATSSPATSSPASAGEVAPPGVAAVTVRRAAERDRAALAQMFERCSAETRYRRFHGHVNLLPARYVTEALAGSPVHFALVAVVAAGPRADPAGDPAADPVAGLASCRAAAEGAAEVGLLVEDAWQRLGIGGTLLREIVSHARGNGISLLKAQILAEQSWIVPVLRAYGDCESMMTHGVLDVTLRLSASP